MNKAIFSLIAIVGTLANSNAQNTLEGTKGSTSIDYTQYGGGIITLNAADKKIELGYINYKYNQNRKATSGSILTTPKVNFSTRKYWYGLSASGKANNDYATIFSNGEISPSSNIIFRFGYRIREYNQSRNQPTLTSIINKNIARANCTIDTCKQRLDAEIKVLLDSLVAQPELWFVGRSCYTVSKFKLFHESLNFNEQFESKRFEGFDGSIGLNYWHPHFLDTKVIFLAGFSIGIRKQNNLSDLNELTTQDVITITNSNVTRSIKSENAGFVGEYKTFTVVPILFDLYFKPHNMKNAALSFYGRVNSYKFKNEKNTTPTNLGLGFYLLNENWLANPVGGITIELQDTFNTLANKSFKERIAFNILTRVNILKYNE